MKFHPLLPTTEMATNLTVTCLKLKSYNYIRIQLAIELNGIDFHPCFATLFNFPKRRHLDEGFCSEIPIHTALMKQNSLYKVATVWGEALEPHE